MWSVYPKLGKMASDKTITMIGDKTMNSLVESNVRMYNTKL